MQSTPGYESNNAEKTWWSSLSTHWKSVFFETGAIRGNPESISDAELTACYQSPVLRIVGPDGSNSNYSGGLLDLEGLRGLYHLEYLFVMHCGLETLAGIEDLVYLKALYLQNNRLTEFQAIRKMTQLQELHISNNQITSLAPLKYCKSLHKVYCENNFITSLDGLEPDHEKYLRVFKCRPNEHLPQREIIRVQNTYGILCN